MLLGLSGRGDKDINTVIAALGIEAVTLAPASAVTTRTPHSPQTPDSARNVRHARSHNRPSEAAAEVWRASFCAPDDACPELLRNREARPANRPDRRPFPDRTAAA